MRESIKKHFSWNFREDVLIEYFRFHNDEKPLEELRIKGKIFEADIKPKKWHPHGGCAARDFKLAWFENDLKVNRAFLIKSDECSHGEPGEFMIVIVPEKQTEMEEKSWKRNKKSA